MKKILKIIAVIIASAFLILVSWLVYFSIKHQATAHQELVAYLNKEFNGQVTFRDFSLSYLRRFPKIQVELMDVSVLDGKKEILTVRDMDLVLNLLSIWKKELKIDHIFLTDVTFFAITDSLGHPPQLLASKTPSAESKHQSLIINARKVQVRNAMVCFRNDVKKNRTWLQILKADLKLHSSDSIFSITGSLEGHLDSLISNNAVLFADLPVTGKDILLEVNRNTGVKTLKEGYVQSGLVKLTPRLRMEPHDDGQLIELNISGGERFDAILAIFRLQLGIDLAQVNPDAQLSLSYNQKGFVNPFKRPYSELDFEIKDAVLNGEVMPFPVELAYAKGNYNNGESHSPATVSLVIDSLYARVNDSYVGGHFSLVNLHDPVVDASLIANIDLSHLVKENDKYRVKGMVDLNLYVKGRLSELRKMHIEGKQQARGEINIHDLDLVLKEKGYSLHIASGTTILKNHLIEISSVSGSFNKSAFRLNGFFENLDRYLLDENEPLAGKLSLNFDVLDLAKLVNNPSKQKTKKEPFVMPFSLATIGLEVRGKKVITPLGDLKNFNSTLLLENDMLNISSLSFGFEDGQIGSSGQIRFDDKGIAGVVAQVDGDFKTLELNFPASIDEAEEDPQKAFKIPDYIQARVKLNVEQGQIAKVAVSKLAVDADINGSQILLHQFRVNAFNGNIAASGRIDLDSTGLAGLILDAELNFDHFKPGEIMDELGLNAGPEKKEKSFSAPENLDLNLDFYAKKLSYKDLTLSNSGFQVHCDQKDATIKKLHSEFPYGQLDMEGVIRNYLADNIHYKATIALDIDSVNINDYQEKQFLQDLVSKDEKTGNTDEKSENSSAGLPDNLELKLEIKADNLVYDSITITDLDLVLDYTEKKIELSKLDLGFAQGKIHLNGHLKHGNSGSYPGYLYLNAQNLDLKEVLNSFGNFDQEAFTAGNSEGKISTASHHYFELNQDLGFIMDKNLWLVNTYIHHAEFNQVEPIEKTLFFVGHKVKDTMMVSELTINLILAKDKIYFRDIMMNDNIANLQITGEIDLDDREVDIATVISLTDLFFKSKELRIAETQAGIMTLDEDAKLFLRLSGPLDNHKIDLVKKRKFDNYQADLIENISQAEEEFRKQVK